jgi:DNA/RNA-binding domain of Phe-tRNA-synthetase-like protein
MTISVEPHPLLSVVAFETHFAAPLSALAAQATTGENQGTQVLGVLLEGGDPAVTLPAGAPAWSRDEAVRQAVRDMLRAGGYKPTGRGKPASEYLARAADAGGLTSINVAVDACNVVSLHSGFPISVVDAHRSRAPYRIAAAAPDTRYVFNPAGQEIDLGGLLCLFDAEGPCANGVKDSQRTKTHGGTTATLSVIWGAAGHEGRLMYALGWYRSLLHDVGATTSLVHIKLAQ